MRRYARLFFFIMFCFFSALLYSQEENTTDDDESSLRRAVEEAPVSLLDIPLGSGNVSLFVTGSWGASLKFNPGFIRSPLGLSYYSPEQFFTQEVDLTLSLWLMERWFVEAGFLDDSNLNTYRAGYQGKRGEFIQYAGVGNTGLDFPVFPYLDLGSDSPSSFGFYGRLGDGALRFHSLFRYDGAYRDEKIFTGGRERSYSYVKLDNPVRALSFVLPDTNIDGDPVVYIEDINGELRDTKGRRWRTAKAAEYAAGKIQGLIELGQRSAGMVAVSYSKNGNNRPWLSSLGGFLYEARNYFDPERVINFDNIPMCGNDILIDGAYALVIYEPGAFSPFERLSVYEAPAGRAQDAALVRLSSGAVVSGYELSRINAGTGGDPLSGAISQISMYELLSSDTKGRREPESRWPLAKDYPLIYLPGSPVFTDDLGIRFTNYGSAGAYLIGADVVPGSVQVWRGGIQDPNFSYNSSTGEVTLSNPAAMNEVIRIMYLKQGEQARLGSVAAGLGAVYHLENNPLTVQGALGLRWNLNGEDAFTQGEEASPGLVGLSAKAALDYDYLKTHVSAAVSFEQTDTTGLYRAAGMEGNETAVNLPYENSFISPPPANYSGLNLINRADLIFRNYRETTVLGSTLNGINWNGAAIIPSQNKPYPVMDDSLTSRAQVLVMEFALNDSKIWTGYELPLGDSGNNLSRAEEIEIPYRFYGFAQDKPKIDLIVQIGSLSGEDYAFIENSQLIWERTVFSSGWEDAPPDGKGGADYKLNPSGFDMNARIARFALKDDDRLRLGNAAYLRLMVIFTGTGEEAAGAVILAPPIVRGSAFRPVILNAEGIKNAGFSFNGKNHVTAAEVPDMGMSSLENEQKELINRFHQSDAVQRVLKIEWENMESGVSAGVDGRIRALPLANYKVLSFFVKAPSIRAASLDFIVSAGPDSIFRSEFEARIPFSAFAPEKWSKVSIRYSGGNTGISVDGVDVPDAAFKYRPPPFNERASDSSSYIALLVSPETVLDDAGIFIDEIILEEPNTLLRVNAGAGVEYKRPGVLLSLGDRPVLADFLIASAAEGEFVPDGEKVSGGVFNRSSAEISVFGAKVSGNAAFTAVESGFLWSADHGVSRSIGPFSFSEAFFASMGDNALNHALNLSFSSAFYARLGAAVNYDLDRLEKKWNLAMGYKHENIYVPSVSFNGQAVWAAKEEFIDEDDNYFSLWARSWKPMAPDTGAGSDSRKTATSISVTEAAKPVGAVLAFEGGTDFTGISGVTRLENSASLDIPVSIGNTSVVFKLSRGLMRWLDFSGEDALDESRLFFESIADFVPLWTKLPFYTLFAPSVNETMGNLLQISQASDIAQYTAFNDSFGVTFVLPPVYSPASFAVPARGSVRLERLLEQKLDTMADALNLYGGLGFSSVNMFGVMGYRPLFNFYQNDEYSHTIEAYVSIPKDDEALWRLQSAIEAAFYGFSSSVLEFRNTLTLRSEYLLEAVSFAWTAPAEKSLLGVFYNWASSKIAAQNSWLGLSKILNEEHERLRKESLEFAFEYKDNYPAWKLTLAHESIIRVLGRLNFSVFTKINFNEDLKNEYFSLDFLIGAFLRIGF